MLIHLLHEMRTLDKVQTQNSLALELANDTTLTLLLRGIINNM